MWSEKGLEETPFMFEQAANNFRPNSGLFG